MSGTIEGRLTDEQIAGLEGWFASVDPSKRVQVPSIAISGVQALCEEIKDRRKTERQPTAPDACQVLLAFASELMWRDPGTIADRIYGTEASAETQRRRAYALADAAFREIAPLALHAAGWDDLPDEMRALGKIQDLTSAKLAVVSRAVDSAIERAFATSETHPMARGPLDGAHTSAATAAELARDAVASCDCNPQQAARDAGGSASEVILAYKAVRRDITPVREAALRALERAISIKDAA